MEPPSSCPEQSIDPCKLNLDQLYLAVVPTLDPLIPYEELSLSEHRSHVLDKEAVIQKSMDKFRTIKFGFDVVYHSVADGLKKKCMLVDHSTQMIAADLVDLADVELAADQMCIELQSMNSEYKQIHEMIPVEADRQVGLAHVKLYSEIVQCIEKAQLDSLSELQRLQRWFDRQYHDAIASLMRWWKLYDESLSIRFERELADANNEIQVMVRTYKKQIGDKAATVDFLQREMDSLNDQIKQIDDRRREEEQKSKGKLKKKQKELDRMQLNVDRVNMKTQLMRSEEMTLKAALAEKDAHLRLLQEQLNRLQNDSAALESQQQSQLSRLKDQLVEETKLFRAIQEEYDSYMNMINNPPPLSETDTRKMSDLQDKMNRVKGELVSYNQQLRIIQQEVHGLDRLFDRRFQTLQKIGFMFRNETYVRRMLERKFYKSANFMNLAEIGRTEEPKEKKADVKGLQEVDLYGFALVEETEQESASGDRLARVPSNETEDLATLSRHNLKSGGSAIVKMKIDENAPWW